MVLLHSAERRVLPLLDLPSSDDAHRALSFAIQPGRLALRAPDRRDRLKKIPLSLIGDGFMRRAAGLRHALDRR